jgi:hypothetical protein
VRRGINAGSARPSQCLRTGRSQPTVIAREKRGSGGSWGCVLLTNWLIAAGDGSPSCSRIRLPSEKRPFSILCLPHFTENRDNEGPALRSTRHRQSRHRRTWRIGLAVPTFRMGYLRSITLTSARIKNSGRRIVSARLLGRGAARTLNGVLMSAAGRPGAYATRKAISSSAASIAAVYHGQ